MLAPNPPKAPTPPKAGMANGCICEKRHGSLLRFGPLLWAIRVGRFQLRAVMAQLLVVPKDVHCTPSKHRTCFRNVHRTLISTCRSFPCSDHDRSILSNLSAWPLHAHRSSFEVGYLMMSNDTPVCVYRIHLQHRVGIPESSLPWYLNIELDCGFHLVHPRLER